MASCLESMLLDCNVYHFVMSVKGRTTKHSIINFPYATRNFTVSLFPRNFLQLPQLSSFEDQSQIISSMDLIERRSMLPSNSFPPAHPSKTKVNIFLTWWLFDSRSTIPRGGGLLDGYAFIDRKLKSSLPQPRAVRAARQRKFVKHSGNRNTNLVSISVLSHPYGS